MCASGRRTAARRKFTHDIMQTSRSHHKAEWVWRQKNLFIADDTLALYALVAVMSYSGNTYCHAGSSSYLVAQTQPLVSWHATVRMTPVPCNKEERNMKVSASFVCQSGLAYWGRICALVESICSKRQAECCLKTEQLLHNSGLHHSSFLKRDDANRQYIPHQYKAGLHQLQYQLAQNLFWTQGFTQAEYLLMFPTLWCCCLKRFCEGREGSNITVMVS